MDNRITLTTCFLDKLVPQAKRHRIYDLNTPGLLLEVMPTGKKVFRFFRKRNGAQQWETIGTFPETSLERARELAIVLNAQLIMGSDFRQTRKEQRDELTLRELGDFYFDLHAEDRCSTVGDMRKNFVRWFELELDLRLSELDAMKLQMRINKLAVGKHYHRANKALDLIKAILNWGVRKRHLKDNPATAVEPFETHSRTRIVQPHEFEKLLIAINGCGDRRMSDFFLSCLYTGQRSGKVMSMRWEHVDLHLGTWVIGKSKNGEPQIVGLSEAAKSILIRRHQERGLNPWVFPGGRPHQPSSSHLKEPKKMWSRILKSAGIKDLHIHDLRRSLGSYMAMSGENTAVIQKALGHKSMQAAAIYQRVNYTPAKVASDKAISLMNQMALSAN